MDGRHFDALARRIGSRRTAIGGLLAGLLVPFPLETPARRKARKRRHKRRRKVKARKRASDQADTCCPTSISIPPYVNSTTFGSAGSGPSQFAFPLGLTLSGDEMTMWVADFYNHRISVWTLPNRGSTAWTPQTSFGSFGSGPGQFALPTGVAVSGDTLTAWVADRDNSRISVWIRPNSSSTAWAHQTTFGSVGTGPSQFLYPASVAISGDGLTAWVADATNNRIAVWTRPHTGSTAWTSQTTFGSRGSGPSQFAGPTGVAVSSNGLTTWVTDGGNHRIAVWTRPNAGSTAWTPQTTFGSEGSGPSQFQNPYGVAVSIEKLGIWVADTGNNRISVWRRSNGDSTDWTNIATFGSRGSGSREFLSPRGVAVSNDRLKYWVADAGNNRISVWTQVRPA